MSTLSPSYLRLKNVTFARFKIIPAFFLQESTCYSLGINNSWKWRVISKFLREINKVSQENSNLNKIILEIVNPMGIKVLWV